jgi:hypothetical protein
VKGEKPYLALHHIDRNDVVRSKPSFIQYVKEHISARKRPAEEAQDLGASLKGKRTEWICLDRQNVWQGDNPVPSKKRVKVNLYLIIPSFAFPKPKEYTHKRGDRKIELNMFHRGPQDKIPVVDRPRLLVTNTMFQNGDRNYDLDAVIQQDPLQENKIPVFRYVFSKPINGTPSIVCTFETGHGGMAFNYPAIATNPGDCHRVLDTWINGEPRFPDHEINEERNTSAGD